jgi:hypothetical protein
MQIVSLGQMHILGKAFIWINRLKSGPVAKLKAVLFAPGRLLPISITLATVSLAGM